MTNLNQHQAQAFYDAQVAALPADGLIIMEFPKKTAAAHCRIFLTSRYQVIVAGATMHENGHAVPVEPETYDNLAAFARAYNLTTKENKDDCSDLFG